MKVKNPETIVKLLIRSGKNKAKLSKVNMLILGFLAGAFVGIGGLLAIRIASMLPGEVWGSLSRFLFAAVFPVGLIMIIITGSELATGNMTTQPLAWLNRDINFQGIIRNWFFVFIGNVIGALFVALFFAKASGLLASGSAANYIVNIANQKVELSWMEAFLRGIGCNWLVGISIWMSLATDRMVGKIIAVWWPIMAFVAIGFEHSIANTFFVPAGIFIGNAGSYTGIPIAVGWQSFIFNNLIPVTIGNIFGAFVFVSLTGWYVYSKDISQELRKTA